MGSRFSAPKYRGFGNAVATTVDFDAGYTNTPNCNTVQRAIASPAIMAHILSQLSPRWTRVNDPDHANYEDKGEHGHEREDRVVLRTTLAACARVCRAFSGPALDAQWRVLDDVVVLLKVLPHTLTHPGDALGSEDGTDMNSARLDVLALSPDIDDTAWVKFREFARRVRKLNAGPPKCFIHPDVWNGFATIRHLYLSGTAEDIYVFLSAIPPADLRDLSLCIKGSNARTIAGTFRGLKRYLPDALESFECMFCDLIAKGPQLIMRLFHGFLKYHLLKRFCVHMVTGYGLHVYDKDIRAIASGWPNLEQFVLRCGELQAEPGMGVAGPSVTSLSELARGCPQLRVVRLLIVDVGTLPAVDTIPNGGYPRIRYFDPYKFVNDEKADLDEVARVLDHLFPDVADIPQRDVNRNTHKGTVSWSKVQELMRARRAARRLQVDAHKSHA
ncbi:hypothetical protein V8D89_001115 [Ganoderma adspersum]